MPITNAAAAAAAASASRTHIRVQRSDAQSWPTMAIAYRSLIGTAQELGSAEHARIRTALRNGDAAVRDRHGFTWSSVGGTHPESTIAWSDFTFGVELEVMAPFPIADAQRMLVAQNASDWRVVRDGSLSITTTDQFAFELVSPVLQGDAGLGALRLVMDAFRAAGCTVNSSCGMHVHIGVRGMKISRCRKIAIAFLNAEACFDALVPTARRDNRYARSNLGTARYSSTSLATASSLSAIGRVMNGGNSPDHYNSYRYHKLNFQSFVRHGTIEFRQHGGTVESEKAAAWVRLVTGFCAAAASAEQQPLGTATPFDVFLAAATRTAPSTAAYLVARRARLSTR